MAINIDRLALITTGKGANDMPAAGENEKPVLLSGRQLAGLTGQSTYMIWEPEGVLITSMRVGNASFRSSTWVITSINANSS